MRLDFLLTERQCPPSHVVQIAVGYSRYFVVVKDPIWASNTTVTWEQDAPLMHTSNYYDWESVTTTASGDDVWSDTPETQRGFPIVGDRYLLEEPGTTGVAARTWVTEVATNTRYLLLTENEIGERTWHWACGLPVGRSTAGLTPVDALSGPNPTCDFHRPAPTPEPTPTPAPTPAFAPTPTPTPPAQPSRAARAFPVTIVAIGHHLAAARKRGLTVRYRTTSPATVKFWLIDRTTRATIGRASKTTTAAGTVDVKLQLIAVPRKPTVRATLRMTATDVGGSRTTTERPVTLSH